EMATAFATMEQFAYLHPIPPRDGDPAGWQGFGAAWTATLAGGEVDPAARAFARLGRAWRERQPEVFNSVVQVQRGVLARELPGVMRRSAVETRFNSAQPFSA